MNTTTIERVKVNQAEPEFFAPENLDLILKLTEAREEITNDVLYELATLMAYNQVNTLIDEEGCLQNFIESRTRKDTHEYATVSKIVDNLNLFETWVANKMGVYLYPVGSDFFNRVNLNRICQETKPESAPEYRRTNSAWRTIMLSILYKHLRFNRMTLHNQYLNFIKDECNDTDDFILCTSNSFVKLCIVLKKYESKWKMDEMFESVV